MMRRTRHQQSYSKRKITHSIILFIGLYLLIILAFKPIILSSSKIIQKSPARSGNYYSILKEAKQHFNQNNFERASHLYQQSLAEKEVQEKPYSLFL